MNLKRTILAALFALCITAFGEIPTLIVPLYDLSYSGTVVEASKTSRIAVIVNVNDGPGTSRDGQWSKRIDSLKANKSIIFGYVDRKSWSGKKGKVRPASAVNNDCKLWQSLYQIDAYFYDDWDEKATKDVMNMGKSIANPGFEMETGCWATVVRETTGYMTAKQSKVKNPIIFAMGEPSFKPVFDRAVAQNVFMLYCVKAGDDWKAYDKLSPFWEDMVRLTRKK